MQTKEQMVSQIVKLHHGNIILNLGTNVEKLILHQYRTKQQKYQYSTQPNGLAISLVAWKGWSGYY